MPTAERDQAGYDFGVRDRIIVVTDTSFIDLIKARDAVAYGRLASFGLLVDVPIIQLVFKDRSSAEQCFSVFRGWIQGSGQDADAVDISFLEFADGSHGIVLGPDINRLLDRTVPPDVRGEYEPLVYAPNIMVRVPEQSEGFRWFKSVASGRPFVMAPATAAEGPLMDLAFRKRDAVFYKEDEVPQDHPAIAYTHRGKATAPSYQAPPPNAEEVAKRRGCQLKRFFPVTLERLRFSETFRRSLAALEGEGLERWQIQQAACNLTLEYRKPALYADGRRNKDPSTPSILNFLLDHPETVGDVGLPEEKLTPELLFQQTLADSRYLLHHFVPDTPDDLSTPAVQDELKRLGMI